MFLCIQSKRLCTFLIINLQMARFSQFQFMPYLRIHMWFCKCCSVFDTRLFLWISYHGEEMQPFQFICVRWSSWLLFILNSVRDFMNVFVLSGRYKLALERPWCCYKCNPSQGRNRGTAFIMHHHGNTSRHCL